MKLSDYVVGAVEAAGILILGVIPGIYSLPILLILAGKHLYCDKLWEVPSSLFNVQTVRVM